MKFLYAGGVWQQPLLHTEIWSDHHPVCLEWHEETEQTETDYIQKDSSNVSKMLKETFLQCYLQTMRKWAKEKSCFKRKGWSHNVDLV